MSLQQLLLLLVTPVLLFAQTTQALDTPRFTLYFPESASDSQPQNFGELADTALTVLNATYEHLSDTFKVEPKGKVVLRFLTPADFYRHTQAPAWTSAMFLRGEISIPVANPRKINLRELTRAIRHEYVHAVVAELSDKRCPAWVDEGIAQLFEGEPNPLLGPALRKWALENEPLPLSWLDSGFLGLEKDLVPVAYAQSLFATRRLVREYGFSAFADYLSRLRNGVEEPEAFESAFGLDQEDFVEKLSEEMKRWAKSNIPHP